MNPLFTTLSVARYEAIVLFRSWFFRIIAPLTAIIIGLLDYMIYIRPEMPWMFNASASFIPYLNLLLLNVIQTVIGVFLASEFLKDDRKLDITEVIYPHSMTNAEYVLGKMLGVFGVFAILNGLILGLGLGFNAFFSDLPVFVAAYLWYPLLISLPTLIFVFGLSFLLMVLIRNQALTIILLLGYIVATLFYLSDNYHHLFDYMAFQAPLAYSDFVGFGDLSGVLLHRGIYLLLGLGFSFLTVRFLRRLPQSRLVYHLSLGLAVLSLGGAIYLGRIYIQRTDAVGLRARMAKLNAEIRQVPPVSLRRCDLALEHHGEMLEGRATLLVVNDTPRPLATLIFSLNPGLEVIAVEKDGKAIPFERELHLLKVSPPTALAPGRQDSLTVSYRGRIEEWVCYPDISDKEMGKTNRILLYNIDKRYAFVRPDYVLLTPECLWYPRAGLSEGAAWPVVPPQDFIDFTLEVTTAAGLRAISQGQSTEKGPGRFEFRPETPLTHLSLAIGPYEMRSITVTDSVASSDSTAVPTTEYSLYYLKGHDFFLDYFTVADSFLPDLLRSSRAQYENRLGLEYPYRRLNLVETPLQFTAYTRGWKTGSETVQPEMVFLPEKAITLRYADFRMMSNFMNRSMRMGRNQMSAMEIERSILQQFINSTFLTTSRQDGFWGPIDGFLMSMIQPWDCALLPMYSYYTRHFSSARWPLINLALEYQLIRQSATEQEEMTNVMQRALAGMAPVERASLALSKRPLDEIISNPAKGEDVQVVMKAKCDYLINLLRCRIGGKEFQAFIDEYCKTRRFTDTKAEDFVLELSRLCNEDLSLLLDGWARETRLPAYTIGIPRQYQVTDGDRTRYQILLTVTNDSETDGVVGVNFVWSKGRGFEQVWGSRPQNPADERFYEIGAGRSKEIGIVLDIEIYALWIDTGLSLNLPCSKVLHFSETTAEKGAAPFEGERELAGPASRQDPGMIIVDNEDPGFELKGTGNQSFLKKLIHRQDSTKEDYVGLLQAKPPARWSKALYGNFYGEHKHSGCYIKAGSGENTACWKADLPRHGNYELCYHTMDLPARQVWNPGGTTPRVKDFHFTVYEDDGPKEMSVDLDTAGEGWYSLGTFYFSAGEARVELSDRTKGRIVYADAVRWTLVE